MCQSKCVRVNGEMLTCREFCTSADLHKNKRCPASQLHSWVYQMNKNGEGKNFRKIHIPEILSPIAKADFQCQGVMYLLPLSF